MTSNNVSATPSLPEDNGFIAPPGGPSVELHAPEFTPLKIITYQELFFRKPCRPSLWEPRSGKQLAASVVVHLVLLCGIVLLIYKLFSSRSELEKQAASTREKRQKWEQEEKERVVQEHLDRKLAEEKVSVETRRAEEALRVAQIKAEGGTKNGGSS